jgi:large repetitive protein
MKKNIAIVAIIFCFNPVLAQNSTTDTSIETQRWNFSATGLPLGLSINAATGVISGKIDRAASRNGSGVFDIVVTIEGRDGANGQTKLRINLPNTAPVARDDETIISDHETSTALYVLANDNDAEQDDLSITFAEAGHGSLLISSKTDISYLPSKGFSGTDIVHYTISDGYGGTATATVRVIVPTAR